MPLFIYENKDLYRACYFPSLRKEAGKFNRYICCMTREELFMRRCFDLARLGEGATSPNPMVGAVLVHQDRIIGEGFHQHYGHAHAEVNAVGNVKPQDRHLISKATLFVSLEPCCIYGRTPPCTSLILQEKIPEVVVSVLDYTTEVKGKGISLLRSEGVKVRTGILAKEGAELSVVRNTFVAKRRPYIALKYACSANGIMGVVGKQIWISNQYSKRLSHKLRNRFDAILIGTTTAMTDDPSLNNRLWYGSTPLKVLIDRNLKVSPSAKLFHTPGNSIVVCEAKKDKSEYSAHVEFLELNFEEKFLEQMLSHLAERGMSSLLVEGGAATLQQFIEHELWDEAWVFTSDKYLEAGIPAPQVEGEEATRFELGSDLVRVIHSKGMRNFVAEIARLSSSG